MIREKQLPNGLRVLTERIPHVRSCGVGVWIELGSRHETEEQLGLSHFLEHMLFKGTPELNAQDIGNAMNYLGGNMNAYTTQEVICLHAKTVERKGHEALELIGKMITQSNFPDDELKRERQVVLEEYNMYEDSPEDLSVDLFLKNLWPDHPLGRPVIGSLGSIKRFSRTRLVDFWGTHFDPSRIVISIAGSFDAKACEEVIKRLFGSLQAGTGARRKRTKGAKAAPTAERTYLKRPVEQVHFCLGVEGPSLKAKDRFPFALFNMVLGGGTSSRLFQEVREKRGLAYSIGSFAQLFSDSGCFAVTGGTSVASLAEVHRIVMQEVERMRAEPPREQEVDLARDQIIDAMMLGLENTEVRMIRMAESLLAFGRIIPMDETIAKLRAIEPRQVHAAARKYLKSDFSGSWVGPKTGRLPRS